MIVNHDNGGALGKFDIFKKVAAGVTGKTGWVAESVRILKRFEKGKLSGDSIQVTYSSSSFTGDPIFSYRDPSANVQFNGCDIRCESTDIGELLTVTLEQIPDLRTVTFTLLFPVVNLLPGSAGTCIQLPGITTTMHTSIAGPVLGPQKTYSQVTLSGTAQAVVF